MIICDTSCSCVRHDGMKRKRYSSIFYEGNRKKRTNAGKLVPIILKSEEGWNQALSFGCTIIRGKMKTEWMKQRVYNATPL